MFARSINSGPTQNDLFWNWGAGESGNSASVPCLLLVHPLLGASAGICLWGRAGVLPWSLARPWSTQGTAPGPPTARGLCWNTPAGESGSPALVPGPPTAQGLCWNTPALTMSLTSKCPEAKAIELGGVETGSMKA